MTLHQTLRNASLAVVEAEPLSVAEAKTHLRIPQGDASHNNDIERLITAARELFEKDTQLAVVARDATEQIDYWPDTDFRLYHFPVNAITSINYFDTSNVLQLLSDSVYSLDALNRIIHLAVGESWPNIESRWDAVTIVYSAGEATVTEAIKSAIKLQVQIGFDGDDEKGTLAHAYEMMVRRYQRSSYP